MSIKTKQKSFECADFQYPHSQIIYPGEYIYYLQQIFDVNGLTASKAGGCGIYALWFHVGPRDGGVLIYGG